MSITIALAGNPNCGKTTMFNELTGSSQYVGNWPGVTVEKKDGRLRGHKDVVIMDLPGIYSLSPYSLEEVISRNYLVNERPDVIINLVDGTNIERNLFLTTQLLEVGIPVVVALNMIDIVNKSKDRIDSKKLAEELGCEVIETSALKGTGLDQLTRRAIETAKTGVATKPRHAFSERVESALGQISEYIKGQVDEALLRWYAVKLFERDDDALKQVHLKAGTSEAIEKVIQKCEADLNDDSESIITNERYEYIAGVVKKCVRKGSAGMTTSDKIDRVVTNRWLALPIFAAVMWFVYYVSVSSLGTIVTDWTNDVLFGEWIMGGASTWLESVGAAPWLQGLIVDGIIGGVGAVLGFVPQMLVLFFFLAILEDCGYMARIAFIMDRVFRKFGLSGKSFIPMLISSGCGVPGIMATRTIENEKDRKMTMMLTTFVPCGAKIPIIALMAGVMGAAFDKEMSWVAPAAYFMGIAMIIVSGIILKKTKLFAGDPTPFVMELPQYHVPGLKGVLVHMWERSRAFIVKAGTVIFVACGLIWFLANFGWNFQMVDDQEISMLASLGRIIAPLLKPLGFGTWQAAVATVSALVAKENVVGTFGVLFGIAEAVEDDPALIAGVASMFTAVSAFGFMVFNLYNPPCFAAIGALRREMGGWRWTLIALGYQTGLAYVMAFIVQQLGSVLFLDAPFGFGAGLSILFIVGILWLLFRSYDPYARKSKSESSLTAKGVA